MKRSTIKHFHTRLILILAGAAVAFLGFFEFNLSESILSLFIGGFGFSMVAIAIAVLRPDYSLSRKIFLSFSLLLLPILINWLFILLAVSIRPFIEPNIPGFVWLMIVLGIAISLVIIESSFPVIFQNLLKLFTISKIRSLIVSFLVVYISFIFFFALCYATIYKFIPDSFEASQNLSLFDLTYYSGVTITTLGYGDIRALHWVSKLLSMIEVIIGLGLVVIYMGITAAIVLRESFQGGERANKEKK